MTSNLSSRKVKNGIVILVPYTILLSISKVKSKCSGSGSVLFLTRIAQSCNSRMTVLLSESTGATHSHLGMESITSYISCLYVSEYNQMGSVTDHLRSYDKDSQSSKYLVGLCNSFTNALNLAVWCLLVTGLEICSDRLIGVCEYDFLIHSSLAIEMSKLLACELSIHLMPKAGVISSVGEHASS